MIFYRYIYNTLTPPMWNNTPVGPGSFFLGPTTGPELPGFPFIALKSDIYIFLNIDEYDESEYHHFSRSLHQSQSIDITHQTLV
jgi:hypothetical protein